MQVVYAILFFIIERLVMLVRILGIVVEYNPFHNGHKYHIEQAKKLVRPHVTIAVMSGSFLQRGEPAIADKWTRAEMALSGGVDIVIELPFQYAVQKAELFAEGAVSSLHAIGVTDLCFGSESGNIDAFYETAEWIKANQTLLNQLIKENTASGKSYPRSFSEAFNQLREDNALVDLSQPNNILGLHYVQSCLSHHIRASAILRSGASHHDETLDAKSKIASATSLRKHLKDNPLAAIAPYVPAQTLKHLQNYKNIHGKLHSWEDYYPFLQYKLFTSSPEELRNIYECEEGLENRLVRFRTASDFAAFIEAVKTKRYTRTRLQRLCTHILNDSKKEVMHKAAHAAPDNIRLLGMNKKGRAYLQQTKKQLSIPIVSKAADISSTSAGVSANAADVHSLVLPEEHRKYDYEQQIILKKN